MKKILLIISILFFIINPAKTDAATPTPTTAAYPTAKEALDKKLNEQINNLKEKIASRVSELNLVERRGMIGVISEVSGNKITLTDASGKTRFVDVDEITKQQTRYTEHTHLPGEMCFCLPFYLLSSIFIFF